VKVLIVEPGYRNKYPPLGLMKISAYHKRKKDEVVFVKGEVIDLKYEFWDRIYITTLFTFYFELTVHTIRYYKRYVKRVSDIYVGGILASLMTEKLKEEAGIENVIAGVLKDSAAIGYSDGVCIDALTPDYSMLDQIAYSYPASDCYLSYTTRGCPNRCSFCAVPRLEPHFEPTGDIAKHIHQADRMYGTRKNLLLLDNNILNSPDLGKIVSSLLECGFTKKPTYIKKQPLEYFFEDYEKGRSWKRQFSYAMRSLEDASIRDDNQSDSPIKDLIIRIKRSSDPSRYLFKHADEATKALGIVEASRPSMRYIDFNQGLDAALLTDERLGVLAQLPIRPLRIAFDSINDKDDYTKAVKLAKKHGFGTISNYLLYNYIDHPADLWQRININTQLRSELGLSIFSFPMKYSPISMTDRKYVGKHWNKKYLRAINDVLLVKKGIVSSNRSFVEKAFGKNLDEFFKILAMPQDFIIYRTYFENNGMTAMWDDQFLCLSQSERDELLHRLSNGDRATGNKKIKKILELYEISYEEEVEQN
jgi:hypothetical protein